MHEIAVKKGAEWLDETAPGWENRIDTATLDINECDRCVLGQIFGQMKAYAACFGGTATREWAIKSGFLLSQTTLERPDWKGLSAAWVQEIFRRRVQTKIQQEVAT